jgi:hypothetical protein
MANIGEPVRRVTVVPVKHPIKAPEPSQKPVPAPSAPEKTPVVEPEKIDA